MQRIRNHAVLFLLLVTVVLGFAATPSFAAPVNGMYTSTDLGGQLMTGRATFWRPTINSGFPRTLHIQSWDGSTLGTQWEMKCPTAPSYVSVVDNRVNGVGQVIYTTVYNGGTFVFHSGGWPWGSGSGTLGTTTTITTDQHIMIGPHSVPVASVTNGTTSGMFSGGCALTFAIANGAGVGQTTSLDPSITKPADYPAFYDATCSPAPPTQEFGGWGTVITITMNIDCATDATPKTWGDLKVMYR